MNVYSTAQKSQHFIVLTLFFTGFVVKIIENPLSVIGILIVIGLIFLIRMLYQRLQQNPTWMMRFRNQLLRIKPPTINARLTKRKKSKKHSFRVINGNKKNSL